MAYRGTDTTDTCLTCGELLQRYRRLAGFTQEQLADMSGYSTDYVGKLERGQRLPPTAALNRIAEVLGIGVSERGELLRARELPSAGEQANLSVVGRHRERGEIRRQLAGVGPAVLLLRGEPGIGKTRLLEEAATLAARSGWRVIHGGCQRRAGDPYAPLAEAVADSLRQLSERERDTALRAAGHLHLLLPELLGTADTARSGSRMGGLPVALPAAHERRLLFTAVTDYFQAVAGDAGTMLVLDDLQWAGQDALDLLAAVATHGQPGGPVPSRTLPVRVIGSYRDTAPAGGSPIGEFVAEHSAGPLGQVLALEPLADAESHELLLRLLPADVGRQNKLLAAIVRRAGGIPLFVVSYAEELGRPGHADAHLDVPWTVAQVVRQRVAALPQPAQEMLGVAALAGRVVQAELLAQVTNHIEQDVLEELDASFDARLLKEEEDGYRFAHDLVRETIEHDLSEARRRFWHQRIGAALARLPERRRRGRDAEIAAHFLQAYDRAQALPWAVRDGDASTAVFAYSDAEEQYRFAMELAGELGEERIEAEAAEKRGDVLYRLGRYGEAIELLERAAGIYDRQDDREHYLTVVARCADAYQFSGRIAEGIERVRPVVRALEANGTGQEPSPGAADVHAALSSIYLSAGAFQEALATAETAVWIGERAGNLRALCVSEICRGIALGLFKRHIEQRQAFERAARIAVPLGDPWMLATARLQEATSYLAVNDLAEGERHIRRALEVAESAGLTAGGSFIRSRLADVLMTRGRWAQARQEAERAEAESRSLAPGIGHTFLLVTLGRILVLQGDRDDGRRRLRQALAIATDLQYPPGIAHAGESLAWQEVREGRPQEAIARLEPILDARRAAGQPAYSAVYAWAQLETGDDQRAGEILAGARQLAEASSEAVPPEVLLHSARLAARQGRWEDAVADLEEGLADTLRCGLPYEHALLLEAYADVDVGRAEFGKASERLVEALRILHELGASPDVERVQRTIEALAPHRSRIRG